MKMMAPKVNIIPIISKADSLTLEELELNKKLIMEDIRHYQISIYGFPGGDGFLYGSESENEKTRSVSEDEDAETSSIIDEEFIELNKYIRTKLPFSVIGASEIIDTGTSKIQARRYPWGVLDVDNPEYSDVELLRDIITRTHLTDLKETTHFILYENYRTQKLSNGLTSSVPATPALDSLTGGAFGTPTNASAAELSDKLHAHLQNPAESPSATNYPQQYPFSPGSGSGSGTNSTNVRDSGVGLGGGTESIAESNVLLAREEQLRASEEKLRLIESKVQSEILQKRQELVARERELRELEQKLKSEADSLRSGGPSTPLIGGGGSSEFNSTASPFRKVNLGYGYNNNSSRGSLIPTTHNGLGLADGVNSSTSSLVKQHQQQGNGNGASSLAPPKVSAM